jgi:hypothetical protein
VNWRPKKTKEACRSVVNWSTKKKKRKQKQNRSAVGEGLSGGKQLTPRLAPFDFKIP